MKTNIYRHIFKVTILIICISFIHKPLLAQINANGFPLITNYSDVSYNAFPQNWQAVQDKRGVMYFANQTGILEYDGRTWRLIKPNKQDFMRSLAIDDEGIIYFGTSSSFGYLTPDLQGNLSFVTLSDLIEERDRLKYDFWKIITDRDHVYFFNIHSLFRYNKTTGDIDTWDLEYDIFQIFLFNHQLYLSSFDKGLIVLKDEKLVNFENSDFFFDIGIVSIIPLSNNEMLVVTYDMGIYHIKIENDNYLDIRLFNEDLHQKTSHVLFYSALRLNEHEIALGTIGSGLYIIDLNGRLISVIDENSGLISNNISSLHISESGHDKSVLWAVSDKGIGKVEWFSPIKTFSENSGLKGAVTDAVRFEEILYLATMEGLFYYGIDDKTKQPVFNKVSGLDKEVWHLAIVKSANNHHLIASTSYNLFEIKDTRATQITSTYSTSSVYQLKTNPSIIYISLDRGLAKLNITQNRFVDVGTVKESGLTSRTRIITEDVNGNLWLFSANDGVIHYNTQNDTIIKVFNQNSDSLFPIINTVFEVNKQLYLGTHEGIYEYDDKSAQFFPTTIFSSNPHYQKLELMRTYVYKDDVWAVIKEDNRNIIGRLNFKEGTFKRVPFNRIVNQNLWGFYLDFENLMIFSSDLVYFFDLNFEKNFESSFNALIRKVVVNNDSTIFGGNNYVYDKIRNTRILAGEQHLESIVSLPFAFNNIYFEFSAPFFEAEDHIEFSFFLEGNDVGWSDWTKRNDREYTNLFEGKYTFHVKARNIYGKESHIASYRFIILPPWYRTTWAYISYFILFVLLIWGIVKLSIYRLQKINEAYGKYLPGSFLKMLDKRRVIDFRLGDMTEKEMTIMFSDIRAYTSLSESMTPNDNFKFLVRYLKHIGEMLNKNKGFPVQYYGDGVMAMFQGKTDNSVQAAIDMHRKVADYSKSREEKGRRPINIGVGLHNGNIIMGIRGDEWRWEGGIVGDAVNIAARVEGLTKLFNAATIVSEDVYDKLENPKAFNFRYLGKVKVKGKETPIKIYELIDGNCADVFEAKMSIVNDFNKAANLFVERKLDEALDIFIGIVEKTNDKASVFYIEMIKKIKENPEQFDGTLIIETK